VSDFESADFTGSTTGNLGKTEREGLPPGYRMRADAHYVDSLTGSRAERARDGRTGASDELSRVGTLDRRLFDHLADEVAAIESAAAMLTHERSPLARRVGLDLIKAQSARAAWLLRATALAAGTDADAVVRRRPLGAILADVRERAGVECRLVGVVLEVDAAPDATGVELPEMPTATGLTGAIMAQLGLLTGVEGALIRVRVAAAPGETSTLTIDVVQDAAPLPASAQSRFFDASWVNRPGGWVAATGAATARAAAERLGGTAAVALERRSCVIRWTLP
jgi:hypothetical protein